MVTLQTFAVTSLRVENVDAGSSFMVWYIPQSVGTHLPMHILHDQVYFYSLLHGAKKLAVAVAG